MDIRILRTNLLSFHEFRANRRREDCTALAGQNEIVFRLVLSNLTIFSQYRTSWYSRCTKPLITFLAFLFVTFLRHRNFSVLWCNKSGSGFHLAFHPADIPRSSIRSNQIFLIMPPFHQNYYNFFNAILIKKAIILHNKSALTTVMQACVKRTLVGDFII
jgi:hypothetical protein